MINVRSSALITPLGSDLDVIASRLAAGEYAARPNPVFDARSFECTLAAAIADKPAKTPHDRVLRRMGRFAFDVASRALQQADVETGSRLGLFAAVGGLRAHWDDMMAALVKQTPDFADSWQRGLRGIHPFWMLRHLSNNTHALLSKDLDARGDGVTFAGATAGAQAIEAADLALEFGSIDAALIVAYDSLLEPETVALLGARRRATRASADDFVPPYEEGADGFVPGEAAAAMVAVRGGQLRAATAADGTSGLPQRATIRAAAIRAQAGDGVEVFCGAGLGDEDFDRFESSLADEIGANRTTSIAAKSGQLGAATALVDALCLLHSNSRALAISAAAPGLAAAVYTQP